MSNEITQKSEEERIREIIDNHSVATVTGNMMTGSLMTKAAKAIYKEIIEPLKKENEELLRKNYYQRTIIASGSTHSTDPYRKIAALETRIQELEAEKDELKAEMQQWIEASQGL